MKKITLTLYTLFLAIGINAQTADILKGCAPLEVNFTGPAQATYFWDFGDSGSSDLQNPSHIFDDSGVFNVELFTDETKTTKIGDVEIIVFANTQVMISADEMQGCSPLQVQFTNQSIVDPNLNITGYFWDFGDAGNSTQENPIHTYSMEGVFPVTLTVESDDEGCTQSMTFTDFIQVSGSVQANFMPDPIVACEAPGIITITNTTVDMSGYTYQWDFGNGTTSNEFNPGAITYEDEGQYTIQMIVDNGEGCEVKISRTVRIGKPKIDIQAPDTVCIDLPFTFINMSDANQFAWSFGSGANPQTSSFQSPTVTYSSPGPKIVTFSAIASDECQSDTFFTVFVEDPSAAFTIDPITQCGDPATYVFTHPNPNFAQYLYTIDTLDLQFLGSANETFIYDVPDRDTFFINRSDTFLVNLDIITQAGCKASDSTYFIHRAPDAHFIPNRSRGCAPLTINFDETSKSTENITSWTWLFGDGTTANSITPEDMVHTYEDPGEYFVKLIIENDAGCIDTSAGVWIYVGEKLTAEYQVDQTEICLYESITITTDEEDLDDRIDAYHFNTDDGRISDCYNTPDAAHQFIHSPGTYPVTLTIEYNGCFNEINNGSTIDVNGSKSRIRYMTNCKDPLTVMLQDSSVNATSAIWYIDGDTINMDTIPEDTFNYTFDTTGDYQIYLITDDDTSCPPDTSTAELFIRQITAEFELPEYICAEELIQLDASLSQDVDDSCSKGYTWYGVARRPRTLDVPTVPAAYGSGLVSVMLITEDVNGCTDTLRQESRAYESAANFETDKEKICFPSVIQFNDLSTADTTIVDWQWSFGSNAQNPLESLTEESPGVDPIELIITDAIGCMDTLIKNLNTYKPTTDIDFSPSNVVCLGESIDFTATDFTSEGSFLNYTWLFGNETFNEQNPSYTVNNAGVTTVTLIIEEDSTGCINEYNLNIQGIIPPEAVIGLDQTEYCADDNSVLFMNNSTIDGPGGYFWNFGNGSVVATSTNPASTGFNPSQTYEIGEYEVTLTAQSIFGCSSVDTKTIKITAPQGRFDAVSTDGTPASDICIGDEIQFTLADTIDVETYTWDFGDGTTIQDENPVTHAFDFYPPGGMYDVVLALVSKSGCKTSVTIPVSALNLEAIIFPSDTTCLGEVNFQNDANVDPDQLSYAWTFGNGDSSSDQNPLTEYETPGEYIVSLTISNNELGCQNMVMDTLTVASDPPLTIPLDLVCDTITEDILIQIADFNEEYIYNIEPDFTANGVDSNLVFIDLLESTEYIIEVTNPLGCSTSDTINFTPPTDIIDIPNIFSPNNDENNDYFDIVLDNKLRPLIEPVIFQVYNRWGNLVYDNETPTLGWDGRLDNGDVAPAEIYTYVIKISEGDPIRKGTVTLIK